MNSKEAYQIYIKQDPIKQCKEPADKGQANFNYHVRSVLKLPYITTHEKAELELAETFPVSNLADLEGYWTVEKAAQIAKQRMAA